MPIPKQYEDAAAHLEQLAKDLRASYHTIELPPGTPTLSALFADVEKMVPTHKRAWDLSLQMSPHYDERPRVRWQLWDGSDFVRADSAAVLLDKIRVKYHQEPEEPAAAINEAEAILAASTANPF